MSPERWAEMERLLNEALELPPEDREAFLGWTCEHDEALRQEVEALIRADEKAGYFMAGPILEHQTGSSAPELPSLDAFDDVRFPPGTVLAGRYRIVSALGRGGMGVVYRAEDLKLRQAVALKFLPESRAKDEATLSRFLDEVKIARQVSHPNVCRVYDISELDGLHFLSMEYIDGEDLASLLLRIGRPTEDKAIEIAHQVCSGLAAAHQQGILHRDLKPANLMVDGKGRARITDFGIAMLAGSSTGQEARHGTPAYMAPEQFTGDEVSIRTDLFALGLVMYELFTGQRAFQGESPAHLYRKSSPIPPSSLVADLDPAVERVILDCLEMDPHDRPSSAHAVAAALLGGGSGAQTKIPKTLVVRDLIGRETWTEELGDEAAKRLGHLHDRTVLELLEKNHGRRIGATDVFDEPIHAVRYALALHQAYEKLSFAEAPEVISRVGIHLGEVFLTEQPAPQGAPLKVERLARETAARLTRLAEPRQTLLTRIAFDQARKSQLAGFETVCWLAHGIYEVEGSAQPLEVFEVGLKGSAPLRPPRESQSVHRRIVQESISGWRPAPGLELPYRPHWQVDNRLSESRFGEVWLAVHKKTRERRVFKFCHDPESLRALQREITVCRLLKEELGDRDDIARILDWNFDRAPYFIEAEYTAGGSLVEWAAEQGGLGRVPLATRLEIVAQIGTALAAAHSVGVLHKDVKPSNVLITTDPQGQPSGGRLRARLSDFGVGLVTEKQRLAEAGITVLGLTEMTESTTASSYGGTRLYMAAELLEGKPATLQADIYALGVVLYQMVVGDLSRALAPGWERDVDDELLAEDIAAAVDGAPERRLGSALHLAERLRNLESRRRVREAERREQEEAKRLRASEARLRRRRRVMAIVSAMSVLFVVAMAFMVFRVKREAERANREAVTAQQVAQFLVDLFKVSDPGEALGHEATAREMLDRGARQVAGLDEQPQIQARLMHIMGMVYRNLGLFDDAASLLGKALETRRQTHGGEHVEVAESLSALARVLIDKGEFETAQRLAREAWVMRQRLLGEEHADVAESLEVQAYGLLQTEDHEGAEPLYRKSLEMRRRLLGEEHVDVADSLHSLAVLLMARGDMEEAEELYRKSLEIRRRVLGTEHPDVAESLSELAHLLQFKGENEEAEALYSESIDMKRRLLGDEHIYVATDLHKLAFFLHGQGNYVRAEKLYLESLESSRRKLGDKHRVVARIMNNLARLLVDKGDYEKALNRIGETLDISRSVYPEGNWRINNSESVLGGCLTGLGRYEEAEPYLLDSYQVLQESQGDQVYYTQDALRRIVTLYENWGKEEKALEYRDLYPRRPLPR